MSLVSFLFYGLVCSIYWAQSRIAKNSNERINIPFLHQSYSLYIVSCVLPAPPLNGTLFNTNSLNTSLMEGSVITFQCDPGFSLMGAVTVTCNNSGLWDPDPTQLECVCTYTYMNSNKSAGTTIYRKCAKFLRHALTGNTPRPRLQYLHVIADNLAKIKSLKNLGLYCIAQGSNYIYS